MSTAILYLKLCDAMDYESGADGLEWSPEEWAEQLLKDSRSLADAQAEIARLRGALESLKRVAGLARSEWHLSGDIYGAMKRLEDELAKP